MYGQLSRLAASIKVEDGDAANFRMLIEKTACDYALINGEPMSRSECETFGNGILTATPVEVIRWLKADMPGQISRM